ncbi:DUF86 domain-containing protein [Paenibacillus allorhizosphaerae]|uniref:DUF86 domain-containing protein n=1 Tax=Paenibacillus allorhizosphaerae TaxID=2849866 RepID=A0ABM8VI79_9BACL|nr:HepT-like ribonuclease domain-containing protein [Paenibacillus allorhizosphaerae]CAG7643477.1 hypothetical protein PAECIP111802_03027 [Paenibacillus allorhizosphaerae]
MIGLRNLLIHQYFGIDQTIVWEVIKKNLPGLKPNLLNIIQAEGSKA